MKRKEKLTGVSGGMGLFEVLFVVFLCGSAVYGMLSGRPERDMIMYVVLAFLIVINVRLDSVRRTVLDLKCDLCLMERCDEPCNEPSCRSLDEKDA